jgi:hypothetical protein
MVIIVPFGLVVEGLSLDMGVQIEGTKFEDAKLVDLMFL